MGKAATLKVEILADAKGVNKGVNEAEKGFGKLGKLGKLAGPAGAAVAAVGAGVAAMAVAAIKGGSDLEQSMGAVQTVFGKSAKVVERYSDTAANRLGLARKEYNTLAASVGVSLTSMGKSEAQAAKETDKLVARAADLAATFGGTTVDATAALGAAFRGEFDSIERLGISLKASDISAELAARGQSKLTGEALKGAQGQATLDLIMRKSQKAHGAFGREANTLAGQQARLTARFKNATDAVGLRLIPVILRLGDWVQRYVLPSLGRLYAFIRDKVAPVIRDFLTPIIAKARDIFERITGKVNENRGSFEKLRPIIEKVGRFIRDNAPAWGRAVAGSMEVSAYYIGIAIDKFAALISFTERVVRAFQRMRDRVSSAVQGVRDAANTIGNVVSILPGFAAPVTGMVPGQLTGQVGGLGLGPAIGLLTASAGDGLSYTPTVGHRRRAGGVVPTVINMPVTINGALDPVAVARQLRDVLRNAEVRLGRAATYGAA